MGVYVPRDRPRSSTRCGVELLERRLPRVGNSHPAQASRLGVVLHHCLLLAGSRVSRARVHAGGQDKVEHGYHSARELV